MAESPKALTPWFEPDTRPVRKGWWDSDTQPDLPPPLRRYWDGKEWLMHPLGKPCWVQNRYWRGLTREPRAAAGMKGKRNG